MARRDRAAGFFGCAAHVRFWTSTVRLAAATTALICAERLFSKGDAATAMYVVVRRIRLIAQPGGERLTGAVGAGRSSASR
jgi:hypothetical protein